MSAPSKCWVLGGTGLVGRALQRLAPSAPEIDFHFLGRDDYDLTHDQNFLRAHANDLVVDLIPGPLPRDADGMPSEAYHQQFTRPHAQLIKSLAQRGLKKFVFLSSGGTVYGTATAQRPFQEDDRLAPISTYGESKVRLEEASALVTNSIILRPSNIFCTDPSYPIPRGVVGTFLKLVREGKPLKVFGDLGITKGYVSDSDVARAIVLALRSSTAGAFNVCTGVPTSLQQIVVAFEKASGRELEVQLTQSFGNDVQWFNLDTRKARELLCFEAQDDVVEWITAQRL